MRRTLGTFVDRIMGGRGEHSITVPVMDGALKPNDYLDRMTALAVLEEPDNLVSDGETMWLSSGPDVYRLGADTGLALVCRETAPITFLARSPSGVFAIGLDTGGIRLMNGVHDGGTLATDGPGRVNAPTAGVFLDDSTLVVCNGSTANPPSGWRRDLLELGRTGSVVRIDLGNGTVSPVADHLAWPSGICLASRNEVVVSEAWRHRLLRLRLDGSGSTAVPGDLPGYPGRLAPASSGGYWLTPFAVRSQLQEFVVREPRYRREMMATIDPAYWIAPSYSSGKSFMEPLQAGGVIRLGIHKPWAPTRSYGLVARLDDKLQPVWSAHSRANGARHGITSIAEVSGRAIVTARGNDELLAIDHTAINEPSDLHKQAETAQ